jgi:hypothetical protein
VIAETKKPWSLMVFVESLLYTTGMDFGLLVVAPGACGEVE